MFRVFAETEDAKVRKVSFAKNVSVRRGKVQQAVAKSTVDAASGVGLALNGLCERGPGERRLGLLENTVGEVGRDIIDSGK